MSPDIQPDGGPGTSDEIVPEVYDELRKLARARLARERQPSQTLQPTALVHEAYLRVSGGEPARNWDRRGHFFAAAALAMRRILVERARHYQRMKHGSGGRARGTGQRDHARGPVADRSGCRRRSAHASRADRCRGKRRSYRCGTSPASASRRPPPRSTCRPPRSRTNGRSRVPGCTACSGRSDSRPPTNAVTLSAAEVMFLALADVDAGRSSRVSRCRCGNDAALRREVGDAGRLARGPRRCVPRSRTHPDARHGSGRRTVATRHQPRQLPRAACARLRRHGRRLRRAAGSAAPYRRHQGPEARLPSSRDPPPIRTRSRDPRPAAASGHRAGLCVLSRRPDDARTPRHGADLGSTADRLCTRTAALDR